jgi:sarcosine/dimethylglycine N-methyltransferase
VDRRPAPRLTSPPRIAATIDQTREDDVSATTSDTADLGAFYEVMTSTERILRRLERDGVDLARLRAADVSERDLDCQNLGAFRVLTWIADTVAGHSAPTPDDAVLDVGCGIGGPGRFLVERFGCAVTGIDVLQTRIEVAAELTRRTGLDQRLTYRVADVRSLPFDDASFVQAWMLDVGIHVRDKAAMFAELARVIRPGGLLVMHDQTGPLGPAMRPATRGVPFVAPPLPRLIRIVEAAGMRVLEWHDTTTAIAAYFRDVQATIPPADAEMSANARRRWAWVERTTTAYLTTLQNGNGRTGLLIAVRR